MADLKLIETGDGGDFVLLQNRGDLEITDGFSNMPYLALFGGNIEQSTKKFNESEQRFDWWGNQLFMDQNSGIQFNSELERMLNEVALSSSGRILLKQAVERDMKFMKEFSTVSVEVLIADVDRVEILIQIKEPNNLENNQFIYIWDGTKQELNVAS